MKKATAIFTTILLCSCSGAAFNSNLGGYVGNKVRTAGVREYSIKEIDQYDATTLDVVEASYCQGKVDEPKPSRRALVDDLKGRAHSLGGNGILVEACSTAAAAMCVRYMECRGVAYAVPERKGR